MKRMESGKEAVQASSDSCLEVSESMEVNGKKTFGYDEPIIYKRV